MFSFFASTYGLGMVHYHKTVREMKRNHFASMKNHVSGDAKLREKGILRVCVYCILHSLHASAMLFYSKINSQLLN